MRSRYGQFDDIIQQSPSQGASTGEVALYFSTAADAWMEGCVYGKMQTHVLDLPAHVTLCVADLPRMIHASDKDASCTTFWAGKRGLYILLRHRGLRVDVINEDDVLDGPTLAKYSTLYITDPHVSAAATTAIAGWVAAGGTLYATASGGLFDHANAVNTPMQTLLGLQYFAVPPKDVTFATPVVRAFTNH